MEKEGTATAAEQKRRNYYYYYDPNLNCVSEWSLHTILRGSCEVVSCASR